MTEKELDKLLAPEDTIELLKRKLGNTRSLVSFYERQSEAFAESLAACKELLESHEQAFNKTMACLEQEQKKQAEEKAQAQEPANTTKE